MFPTVEFIIPTYDRFKELRSMLASLLAQTAGNWLATVVVDDIKVWDILPIEEPRIKYICTGKRFNDWGHTPREMGKQQSRADYIIMTGDDNYYMPVLIEEINKITTLPIDFIYWDMVHSHTGYSYFKCYPAISAIDMGAFCFKASLGQKIPLGTMYAADGFFVEEFKKAYPDMKQARINKVLFVHN